MQTGLKPKGTIKASISINNEDPMAPNFHSRKIEKKLSSKISLTIKTKHSITKRDSTKNIEAVVIRSSSDDKL